MLRWFARARGASFAHTGLRKFFGDYCFRKTRRLVMAFLLALGREALMVTLYASLRFYTATYNPSFLRSLSNIGVCGTTRRPGLLNPLASNDWTICEFKRLRETMTNRKRIATICAIHSIGAEGKTSLKKTGLPGWFWGPI